MSAVINLRSIRHMNDLQEIKIKLLGSTLKEGAKLYASVYGYCVRIEEMEGCHLLRSILIHPRQGDTIKGAMLDAAAILRADGVWLHAQDQTAKVILEA